MLQVELWLGSWALPNVPFFNHLAPYVKTSYINNWFENEKKEEIDDRSNIIFFLTYEIGGLNMWICE